MTHDEMVKSFREIAVWATVVALFIGAIWGIAALVAAYPQHP